MQAYIGTIRQSRRTIPRHRTAVVFFYGIAACLLALACPFSAAADDAAASPPPQRILVAGRAALMPADAILLFPEARQHLAASPRVNQGLGDLYEMLMPGQVQTHVSSGQSSVEEIARRQPDLVLLKTGQSDSMLAQLSRLRIPYFLLSLETPEEWLAEIPALGLRVGEEARGEELRQQFARRMDVVAAGLSELSETNRPKVLLLNFSSYDGITVFSISPDHWIQTQLVEMAGGVPVWKGAGLSKDGWNRVSFEQIAAWNPDYIYLVSFKEPVDRFMKDLLADSRWQQMPAIKNGRVKTLPGDLVSYAQPVSRWILCLMWLAADLHPEAFPDMDMEREVLRFYEEFMGITDPAVSDAILDAYRRATACNVLPAP